MSDPIEVKDSAAGGQLATGFRYLLMGGGAIAAALGHEKVAGALNNVVTNIGVVTTVGAFFWGQVATLKIHKKQKALAEMLPDSQAKIV